MKILIVDPYLTYSHQVWLKIFSDHLTYDIKCLTLAPFHWKWRMHGGSIELARQLISSGFQPDFILATSMLDLNLFIGLCHQYLQANIRTVLYFHENQITYPVSASDSDLESNFDNHYGFINYSSCMTADKIVFNSHFHLESFLAALPIFLGQFPNHTLSATVEEIRNKSEVIYPGFDVTHLDRNYLPSTNDQPVVLWNHRWEYDKDPDAFFETLFGLSEEGYQFRLVVLGQSFQRIPKIFKTAHERLKNHILHWGFVSDRNEYYRWLWKSDIIVSTSNQDFFGISVVEAIHAACYPLLPNRLAFPEHIPQRLHGTHLYLAKEELQLKLKSIVGNWAARKKDESELVTHLKRYHPHTLYPQYIALFENLHRP